jgi:hypothetical protein
MGAVVDLLARGYAAAGHDVLLCTTADEADMVRRIHDVDRLDRRACRASVEQSFSAERMVADHLAPYERLLVHEPAAACRS